MIRRTFTYILAPLATAGFLALLALERRRPLRRRVSSTPARVERNLAIGAISGGVIQLLFLPAIIATTAAVRRRRLGLIQRLPIPDPARTIITVALLDYSYYWWHRWLHRVPLLWRFHRVHHADLDMDVSTAIRFHFGEWLLSVPFRCAQTVVLGASEGGVAAFETIFVISILFHHSNLRLPARFERLLDYLIVTPRMHGIHHSIDERERERNFSALIAAWDRLHGSMFLDTPQGAITIGLPEYRHEPQVTFGRLLAMPFASPPAIDAATPSE